MAYENVRLTYGNSCTNRDHTYVASFDVGRQAIVEVDPSTGALYKEWPTDSIFTEVVSAEFDGFYWWSLERQSSGFLVRKWAKYGNVLAKLVRTFSYTGSGFYTDAMALEGYKSTLGNALPILSTSAVVADGSVFRGGDTLILGPSTAVGYVGNYDEVVVTGVVGDTLAFSPPVTSAYSVGDAVYSSRAFWVFIDGVSPSNASLSKYSTRTGQGLASSSDTLFSGVLSATFFDGYILFAKGTSIYWYNPASISLYKAMGVDNRMADRSTLIPIYDLFGYNGVVYRLQKWTAYSSGGIWHDASWTTHNTVSSNVNPEVFMVLLSADPNSLHAISVPIVTTASANVLCSVYDQYFIPVVSHVVEFTTTAGTLIPTQATTDTNGQCKIVYLGDSQVGLVKITATT